MPSRSGRFWLVGFLFTLVGVWGGWLPRSHLGAVDESSIAAESARATASEPTPVAEGGPAKGSSRPERRARRSHHHDAAPPPPPDPCARGQALLAEYGAVYQPLVADVQYSRADYLLALVPDPGVDEQVASFKAVVEGLEEAVTDHGHYVRDREWLPWMADDKSCAERAPGVLLFRPENPDASPPRIVLLVGETPTVGVKAEPLRSALASIKTASGAEPVRVLGPTFSGSGASLVALLRASAGAGAPAFRFVSGTATSPHLGELLAPVGPFSATVPDDTALLDTMLRYLRRRSHGQDKIAILSEASTTYGSSVNESAGRGGDLIPLRFPIHLQALSQAVAAAPAPQATPPAPVPPKPEDPHVLVLDEVARDLSRQSVRFVGVVATNPADVVLLTSRLRAKLPDARFFTLGADILFTSPSLASSLNGMLVAHAKPPPAPEISVSLRSEVVRGVFLAARDLLTDAHEHTSPEPRISLVGNGALWEIGDEAPVPEPPRSWRVVEAATWLVFLGVLGACCWPALVRVVPRFRHASLTRHRGPLTLAIGHCERQDLHADDVFVTAALLSAVAGAALLMLIAEFSRLTTLAGWLFRIAVPLTLLACWGRVLVRLFQRKLEPPGVFAGVFSLLALLATGLALGIGCAPPHEATLNLLSGGSGVLAGLLGFGMIAIGLWCWRTRLRFLDTHRFGKGSRSHEPPLAEALGEKAGEGTGFFELEQQLLEVIHSPWDALKAIPVAVHVLLLLSVALVVGVRAPTTFEPGWRNKLVIGFGLIALLPITVNFSRIVATWVLLSRMLKRLAVLPIMKELRELPPELVRNLEAQLTVPNADLSELAPPIELLQEIDAAFPVLDLRSAQALSTWQAALRHQAGHIAEPKEQVVQTQGEQIQVVQDHGEVANLLLEASGKMRQSLAALPELAPRANQYLALLVAIFVPRYMRHFRLYVAPVLIGSVLGVMMTSLYFIQPQRLITSVIFVWVTGMVLLTFLIYSSFDRSAIVSAIGRTTEGSVDLDWTLVSRVLSWGLVPLLSLYAAQNPGFSSLITVAVNGIGAALR